MENINVGKFVFPETVKSGTASYSVPGLSSYSDLKHKDRHKSDNDDDEVTHTAFFGENIKRVLKAFKK